MSESDKPAARERLDALPPASTSDALRGPKAELAKTIPRRPRVTWWLGLVLALGFATLVVPSITAHRWFASAAKIQRGEPAPVTVRVPPFAGYQTSSGVTRGGGVLVVRGEHADRDTAVAVLEIERAMPHGGGTYLAFFLLLFVLGALFTHHVRRSTQGRLLRVQLASLGLIIVLAIVVKAVMLTTGLSILVVPVALFAMVPTLVLDRVVGLATGTLAALVVSLVVPFDVGVASILLVQASAAGLVVAERPKKRVRAAVLGGAAATLVTAATYPLMLYLTAGVLPTHELRDPLHSAWVAAAAGPALATGLAIVLAPLYQLLVGEITQARLVELEDLSHPLLKQIANKAPGTWQHSLTMANMAEIAANAIGANGRLVRVGAYFHDLGKSLQPKYFIENLEPGETSPHDKLPPEVSCDAIFAHVTEGIVTARKAGLHERIVDFMHMHHGNGVLEYFWAKTREQGNPRSLTVEDFRYPGVPPQSRETAILSICDAVEAAARTLKKPEVSAIDNLVQRIVYGKLHLGQLDESGLSMSDLRRLADSLRETIRHANHGRIEYPWQKAQQDASASPDRERLTQTGPRLDSLDRPARPDTVASAPPPKASDDALANTDAAGATPNLRISSEAATRTTAPVLHPRAQTSPPIRPSITNELEARLGGPLPTDHDETRPAPRQDLEPDIVDATKRAPRVDPENDYEEAVLELRDSKPAIRDSRPSVEGLRDALRATRSSDDELHDSRPSVEDLRDALRDSRSSADRDSTPTIDAPRDAFDPAVTQPAVPSAEVLEASRRSLPSVPSAATTQPAVPSREILEALRPSFAATTQPAAPRLSDLAASRLADDEPDDDAIPRESPILSPLGPRAPSSPEESARMSRVTAPIGEERRPSQEALDFAADAKHALDEAAKDLVIPRETQPPARKRAATLPPIRPPTVPPPLGRRSPTLPPLPAQLFGASPPNVTAAPPDALRPPAQSPPRPSSPHATVPPSDELRAPGPNLLDDMVTLRPAYEKRPDLDVNEADDGSLLIEPRPSDDVGDVTNPDILIGQDARAPRPPKTSWAQSLADRIDRQLEDDDDEPAEAFSPDATRQQSIEEIERLHREGLLDRPEDATKQMSVEQLERLHRDGLLDRPEPELQLTRRGPFPTTEVDDSDIEAAIELAPPARKSAIGVAKKKPSE
ncbi:MAG: HDIG domain-containing protein [Kofleriaceae bacterium]|nr:HDIG domain-containing protein [Kofleriaceae bacterium]